MAYPSSSDTTPCLSPNKTKFELHLIIIISSTSVLKSFFKKILLRLSHEIFILNLALLHCQV